MIARSSQLVRTGVVAAAVVLLIALVATASGNERPRSDDAVADLGRLSSALDAVFTITLTLFAVVVVFMIWALRPEREQRTPLPPRARFGLTTFLFFVLVVSVIVYIGPAKPQPPQEPNEVAPIGFPTVTVPPDGTAAQPTDGASVAFDWTLSVATVLVLAALAGFFYWRARARAKPPPLPRVEAELAAVVEATLVDLRGESDPRRAVIAAYAQMERVLARNGLPRRASEAPFEYLARVLRRLEVRPAAALALTELFERARFSHHDVDAAMKAEAIDALDAVRTDLQAAA